MATSHQEKENISRELHEKFDDNCTTSKARMVLVFEQYVLQIADRMYQKGYEKGILEEASGCDEHCEEARKEGYQEASKAFGGCESCYGKGYGTTKIFAGNSRSLIELDRYIPCPKCDRGKQIEEMRDRLSTLTETGV